MDFVSWDFSMVFWGMGDETVSWACESVVLGTERESPYTSVSVSAHSSVTSGYPPSLSPIIQL